MTKLCRFLREIFDPQAYNDLDTDAIRSALNDASVRNTWLSDCIDEMRRINIEVDRRMLYGTVVDLTDLCARRKAIQDLLEAALSARRKIAGKPEARPNPKAGDVNLDRTTA